MSNLTRFDQDGIEIFINPTTGESFASLSGVARMSDEHIETVRRFLTVTNTQTTNAEIETATGKKTVTFLDEDAILVVLEKYNPSRLRQFAKLGIRVSLHEIAGYRLSELSADSQVISELSGDINISTLSYQTLSKLMEVSHFRRNPELIRWNNLAFCKALEGINPVLLEMSADAATYLWAKFCIETDCYKKSLESTDPFVVDITKNAVKEHQKIIKKPKYIKAAQEFQNQLDRQPITALQDQQYKLFAQSCQISGDAEIDKSLRKQIYDLSNKVDELISKSSLSLAASNAQQQISDNCN
jgi:hypothetical protein